MKTVKLVVIFLIGAIILFPAHLDAAWAAASPIVIAAPQLEGPSDPAEIDIFLGSAVYPANRKVPSCWNHGCDGQRWKDHLPERVRLLRPRESSRCRSGEDTFSDWIGDQAVHLDGGSATLRAG